MTRSKVLLFLFFFISAVARSNGMTTVAEPKDTAGLVNYYRDRASSCFNSDSAEQGFQLLMKALDLAKLLKSDSVLGHAHFNLGFAHYQFGNTLPALQELEIASGYFTRAGLKDRVARTELVMGNVHSSYKNPNKAIELYKNAFNYWQRTGNKAQMATVHNNIGLVYVTLNDTSKAAYEFFSSLAIRRELGDSMLIGQTYNNIGTMRLNSGRYAEALEYFKMGLNYRRSLTTPETARLESMVNIGKALKMLNRLVEAELYLREVISKSYGLKGTELKRRAYRELKDILNLTGRYAEAFQVQEMYYSLTDSMFSIQKREETFRHGIQYEYRKKALEDSLKRAEETKRELLERKKEEEVRAEKDKRNLVLFIALGIGLLLTVLMVFVLARRNREKQAANRIISGQKDQLEVKQKEIHDSIRYAKRIQDALLPSEKEIRSVFPDSFIFYRPKDIISGDFYWAETVAGRTWVAMADCTGHGVPGAMMSMLGISFLNEALREMGEKGPARMLDELHLKITGSLHRDPGQSLQDGMDIALLCIDRERRMVSFALASRPVLIVSNGQSKLIKGERFSIGGARDAKNTPYRQLMISLKPGDVIYLFTDGFADQFGGPEGKKFKSKSLEEALVAIASKSPDTRLSSLAEIFDTWKGSYEQVDDVSVLAITF